MDIINKLFPKWAFSRATYRVKIDQLNRYYDAAKKTQYRKKAQQNGNPQLSTQGGAEIIRDHARNLDENHDLSIGILDTLVNNIVGVGIPISPVVKLISGDLDTKFNEQITKVLNDWMLRPEASRTLPFDEMTRIICRTWLRDGEILIQRIKGNTNAIKHHGIVPYSLELIESDYLPFDLKSESPKKIVQGVEINNWSQPLAFHLLKYNPSDIYRTIVRLEDTKRLSVEKVFHIKFVRRINQIRGVSILHGIITRMDDIKNYEESERIAAQVAASLTGFIKKSPDVVCENVNDSDEKRTLEMSPGMIFDDLQPGEDVGMISSDRPNTGLEGFRNAMLKAAASGTGTNYSTISKNYDGSYSSQRQSMIEALPSYEKMRNYFIEVFIRPMYKDFLEMAIVSGSIRLPPGIDKETLYDVDIRGVLLPWIDPKKEVEADILAINNGLKARTNVIRERGGDPVQVNKLIDLDKFKPVDENNATEETPEETPEEETPANANTEDE